MERVRIIPPLAEGSAPDPAHGSFASRIAAKASRRADEAAELEETQSTLASAYAGNGNGLHTAELNAFPVERFVHPDLIDALRHANVVGSSSAQPPGPLKGVAVPVENASDVWILPIFTDTFAALLQAELEHAQAFKHPGGLEWTRPNTMNNFGFVLNELGLGPMLDQILQKVLAPLARMLLPAYSSGGGKVRRSSNTVGEDGSPSQPSGHAGTSLDAQHTFTIRYSVGEDTSLDDHMDQSAVTLNVCLGGDFEGAEVYFKGQRDSATQNSENATVVHRPGFGLLHAGQHWHGAHTLLSGTRENFVMWGRSTELEGSAAESYHHFCPSSNRGTLGAAPREEL